MATEYPGNLVPAPGFSKGNVSYNDELLASGVGWSQKGCTLAAGQGVILLGTPLAQRTSDNRYVKFVKNATGGVGNFAGFLRVSVDTGDVARDSDNPDVEEFQGNVLWKGTVAAAVVAHAMGLTGNDAANGAAIKTAVGRGEFITAYNFYEL